MNTSATVTAYELRCEPETLLRAIETQCEILLDSGRCFATAVTYPFKDEPTRIDRLTTSLLLEVESETLTAEQVLDLALEAYL
jgi:hypothetical protein